MTACVVMTTVGSAQDAESLARSIVDARLAACVQVVGPIRSVYCWQGRVCTEQEWRCEAKTTADRADALVEHVRANHAYDLPEIVSIQIDSGSDEYLDWVSEQVAVPS